MSDPADELRELSPEKRQLLEFLLEQEASGASFDPANLSQEIRELYELLIAGEDTPAAHSSTKFIAPSTPMELAIAQIWREVLPVEQISIHDNFFDLGGHSLLLYQVVNKLQQAHNIDISIIKVFKYSTIFTLAQYLTNEQGEHFSDQQIKDTAQKQREAVKRQKQAMMQLRNTEKD